MSGVFQLNPNTSQRILVIGGGGHSRCIQETLLDIGYEPEDIGIVEIHEDIHALPGIQWVGKDEDLDTLRCNGWNKAVIGVGSIEKTDLRRRLADMVVKAGIELITLIDTSATVSKTCETGLGTFIAKKAVIQPGTRIGTMAIINTGSIVEHDCSIGDFSHISSGVVLLGGVTIEHDTLIGGGSVVRQGIHIGRNCVVGAGSVVVSNIPDNSIAYGNPCKVRRQIL